MMNNVFQIFFLIKKSFFSFKKAETFISCFLKLRKFEENFDLVFCEIRMKFCETRN